MSEASRQKNNPPGLSTRHISRTIAIEVRVIACEVQDGAAEHDVGEPIGERHLLDGLDTEVGLGKRRREPPGDGTHRRERAGIGVDAEDLEAVPEEVDEVAAAAAAGVEDAHARRDASAEQLIEDVDVDLAELGLKIRHVASARSATVNPTHPRERVPVAPRLRLLAPRNLGRLASPALDAS